MQYTNSPWSTDSFNKDSFFEYHLATLFQENNELKLLARKVVNFYIKGMNLYDELDNLYDSPNEPRTCLGDLKEKYLPCEEQMLAFYFSQNLRQVWAAAKSETAFNAVTEIDESSFLTKCGAIIPGVPTQSGIISAAKKEFDGHSFLDVWEILKENLLNKLDENGFSHDLVSWSGHGAVVSFSNDLCKIQNTTDIDKPEIIDKLGFAVIDSYYGSKLNLFYKSSSAKIDDLTGGRLKEETGMLLTANGSLPELENNLDDNEPTIFTEFLASDAMQQKNSAKPTHRLANI